MDDEEGCCGCCYDPVCREFNIIGAPIITAIGLVVCLIGAGVQELVIVIVGLIFFLIGIAYLIPSIIVCRRHNARARQAVEEQRTGGPRVVGYNPSPVRRVPRATPRAPSPPSARIDIKYYRAHPPAYSDVIRDDT